MNSGVVQDDTLQVWRRGTRVAYETRPTRRARLREEGGAPHSFRVRVSVAQTLDDACVDGTFSARRAETPDAWRRFAVGLEDLCRCVQKRKGHEATKPQRFLDELVTVSCLSPRSRAASANPSRIRPSPNRPKSTHGTHANSARSLSPTAASLALSSAATLITTTGDEQWWTQ